MKSLFFLIIGIVIAILLASCEKDEAQIIYPNEGDFGENILQNDSIKIKSSGDVSDKNAISYYSLKAILPSNSSLKLVIKNKSKGQGVWYYKTTTIIGWAIDDYDLKDNSQKIFAYGPNVCDAKIFFTSIGSADIEIYENDIDSIPKRIKHIIW